MRFVMHCIQPGSVRGRALPLDLGMQHNFRHGLPSGVDVAHYPFGVVAIMQRRKTRQPGDMQKTKHMAAGKRRDQQLLGVDRRLDRPFPNHMG